MISLRPWSITMFFQWTRNKSPLRIFFYSVRTLLTIIATSDYDGHFYYSISVQDVTGLTVKIVSQSFTLATLAHHWLLGKNDAELTLLFPLHPFNQLLFWKCVGLVGILRTEGSFGKECYCPLRKKPTFYRGKQAACKETIGETLRCLLTKSWHHQLLVIYR